MEKKWLVWVLIVAIVVVGGGMFWTGRGTGSRDFRERVEQLEDEIARGLERERELRKEVEVARGVAEYLGSWVLDVRGVVDQFQENVDTALGRFDAEIERLGGTVDSIAGLNRESRELLRGIGAGVESVIESIDGYLEGASPDPD
jgi:ABC-type transporter Mla subunit MlaD